MNKTIVLSKNEITSLLQLINNSKNKVLYKSIQKKLEKTTKRIKVASAKGKGRSFQYWVCNQLSELLQTPYIQSDDQSLISSRPMGQHGLDIILRGKALELFPFSIECKNSETFNWNKTLDQVKSNTIKNTDFMIFYRKKSIKNPIIIIEWETFKHFYRKVLGYEN